MNKQKKQKFLRIVVGVVSVAMVASVGISMIPGSSKANSNGDNKKIEDKAKDNQQQGKTEAKADPNKDLRVLWAFADIDRDFLIQKKDTSDGDTTADYIFIKFSNEILTDKSENSATLALNYTFDGKPLPKGTEVLADIQGYDNSGIIDKLTIKLPNGYLKGVNAPHTLDISSKIKSKYGKAITGDLKLQLSYSKSESITNGTIKEDPKKTTSKSEDIPKYTVEVGKSLPYSTLVLVQLDTKTPENYKVSIDGTSLPLKSKSTGEKVFIDVIDKDYAEDEVNKLIKIEKVK
ncbi:hypothetical protein CLHOM_07370 [Clostridium homopropionicum DSM 5847]|uniref:Uncharacterized protein n=1 Tax=Clostridium homopropionicum DSM 5847 TaxID=1121318 RepID=A0A0L6ZCA1_9CLOT|nr:hypothetical protein [Clostridium homopropionicum]KOA20595.1 hypothetical protein CLHOM_07370 [Clostridium homopropionicum DSM 5847]SFF93560.1 hypothetical protein SAMN04488501_103266 [Clostridium homopropionicum]